jgi:hypothetical protein
MAQTKGRPTKRSTKHRTRFDNVQFQRGRTPDDPVRQLRSSETRGPDNEQVERCLKDDGKNVLFPHPSNLLKK